MLTQHGKERALAPAIGTLGALLDVVADFDTDSLGTFTRELCGVDFFVCDPDSSPEALAERVIATSGGVLKLKLITNRGVKVWPEGFPETFCTDHWRCRFVGPDVDVRDSRATYSPISLSQTCELMRRLSEAGDDVIKSENLYLFDGARGFSLGQGE